MIPGLGGWELILIVAVLFLLFGASRLPQLAKSLGQSRKAFREGMREAEEELKLEDENPKRAPRAHLGSVSDEELLEEARRRSAARQE